MEPIQLYGAVIHVCMNILHNSCTCFLIFQQAKSVSNCEVHCALSLSGNSLVPTKKFYTQLTCMGLCQAKPITLVSCKEKI